MLIFKQLPLPPVLQHVNASSCEGEASGLASCWEFGIETQIGNRRRRGCLLPGLGWGDCNCCYREGLPPFSELEKAEGGDDSLSGTEVLSFSLSDATHKKMKCIPDLPQCGLRCAPMVKQSSLLNLQLLCTASTEHGTQSTQILRSYRWKY